MREFIAFQVENCRYTDDTKLDKEKLTNNDIQFFVKSMFGMVNFLEYIKEYQKDEKAKKTMDEIQHGYIEAMYDIFHRTAIEGTYEVQD